MDSESINTISTSTAFKLASYDSSLNSRVALTFPVTRDPVHAMALSNDGKLLAIGNDGGRLEVSLIPSRSLRTSHTHVRLASRLEALEMDGKP